MLLFCVSHPVFTPGDLSCVLFACTAVVRVPNHVPSFPLVRVIAGLLPSNKSPYRFGKDVPVFHLGLGSVRVQHMTFEFFHCFKSLTRMLHFSKPPSDNDLVLLKCMISDPGKNNTNDGFAHFLLGITDVMR